MSPVRRVLVAVLFLAFVASLFYSGGGAFLVVGVTNMIAGLPTAQSFWRLMFPIHALALKPSLDFVGNATIDSHGVADIAAMPFFEEALPFFLIALGLEVLLGVARGVSYYSYADSLGSLSAGLLNQSVGALFRPLTVLVYLYVWNHWRLIDLSDHQTATWILCFLLIDLGYYGFHFTAHHVNAFWTGHEIHHSSEEYNLSTALRQTIYGGFDGVHWYIPAALFAPPSVVLIHKAFNLLFQFWIHTRHIPKLWWPIEFVFNTASHHRVHHGRNPYCIDKNFGGTLIIWDRLFGTFVEEKDDEEITYGIVPPLKGQDPMYAQFHYWGEIFNRMRPAPLVQAWKYLFTSPGLFFRAKKGVWEDVPVPPLGHKWNPPKTPTLEVSFSAKVITLFQFASVIVFFFARVIAPRTFASSTAVAAFVTFSVATLWAMGTVLDGRSIAKPVETLRSVVVAAALASIVNVPSFWSAELSLSWASLASLATLTPSPQWVEVLLREEHRVWLVLVGLHLAAALGVWVVSLPIPPPEPAATAPKTTTTTASTTTTTNSTGAPAAAPVVAAETKKDK